MTSERASDALAATSLFANLTQQELEVLEPSVQCRRYTAGEEIYPLGSAPDQVFVVVTGEVDLLVPGGDGERVLSTRGPATVFGEMAALDGEPRMVRARARTDAELRTVDANAFLKLLASSPHVREELHDFMVQITRELARDRDDAGVGVLRAIASAMRHASTSGRNRDVES